MLQYALYRRQTAKPAAPPQLGPPLPSVAVDGIFGAKTKKAVETFQANTAGLTRTGQVTAQDWQAIVAAPYIDASAQWTVLAFADDPLDPLSTAVTSVQDLVLNNRHATVRSVSLST